MDMESLKKMKECLIGVAEGQVYGNIEKVNAEELGEVMDMIKDLSEAVYYCTITESMEKQASMDNNKTMYYSSYPMEEYDPRYRDRRGVGTMYAQGGNSGAGNNMGGQMSDRGSVRNFSNNMPRRYSDGQSSYMVYHDLPEHIYRDGMMHEMRDPREGRSGERRKMYMEGKGYKDKAKQMQELENYMQELASDLTEMVQDASPEEKQLLQNKIATLASKVK